MQTVQDLPEAEQVNHYRNLAKSGFALVQVYKGLSFTLFVSSLILATLLGWYLHEGRQQQQQLNNLKQAANDAQWELENSPPPEGTMRAINLLEKGLK